MKKRSFIMLLCAIVVMSSAAFGTIAYLTDRAAVKNTFTVGNVDITVDETKVNPDGTPVEPAERTEESNDYKLLPGQTYVKDPTLTVKAKSEEAYVRMVVTISKADELDAVYAQLKAAYPTVYTADSFMPENFVDGWDKTVWPCVSMTKDTENNSYVLVFNYKETVVGGTDDTALKALFTKVKVPGEVNGTQLETITGMTIDVVGQAIQATGFADADAAWEAFGKQAAAEAAVPTVNPEEQPEP